MQPRPHIGESPRARHGLGAPRRPPPIAASKSTHARAGARHAPLLLQRKHRSMARRLAASQRATVSSPRLKISEELLVAGVNRLRRALDRIGVGPAATRCRRHSVSGLGVGESARRGRAMAAAYSKLFVSLSPLTSGLIGGATFLLRMSSHVISENHLCFLMSSAPACATANHRGGSNHHEPNQGK